MSSICATQALFLGDIIGEVGFTSHTSERLRSRSALDTEIMPIKLYGALQVKMHAAASERVDVSGTNWELPSSMRMYGRLEVPTLPKGNTSINLQISINIKMYKKACNVCLWCTKFPFTLVNVYSTNSKASCRQRDPLYLVEGGRLVPKGQDT
ncbi:unnamed protein product [Rhizoctonia solani]|uniref:Uncharacterized protein n=1 Tax=Rhizoctonia solani TaxID=456999 RepID=A0A8H3C2S8_9AGAM|nr:unnamed protein product [Rhizoctonia solani]